MGQIESVRYPFLKWSLKCNSWSFISSTILNKNYWTNILLFKISLISSGSFIKYYTFFLEGWGVTDGSNSSNIFINVCEFLHQSHLVIGINVSKTLLIMICSLVVWYHIQILTLFKLGHTLLKFQIVCFYWSDHFLYITMSIIQNVRIVFK